jgi:hypothetical protein
MLIDPLASVQISTGILPVVSLSLPPDLVAAALGRLALTLFTHPVLRPPASFTAPGQPAGFALPLPTEPGQAWSWVTSRRDDGVQSPTTEAAIPATAADHARWGYTPLILQEGWLRLTAADPVSPDPKGAP